MVVYVCQYCRKDDKTRNFKVYGVFDSFAEAKEYIGEEKDFDYFIDEYQTGSPMVKNRKYQSW